MFSGREILKAGAHAAATVLMLPAIGSFRIRSLVIGADRALEGSTQALALLPGVGGQYLRRAFLRHALAYCDWSATIAFGVVFSQCAARLEAGAYIGPRCHIGWAHIGRDALVAAGVHIPSGGATHGFGDLTTPIRLQPHHLSEVRIGDGAWIGSAAVVMADVGRDAIVGAGAVVTRALPDRAIAAGIPARILRYRVQEPASAA